MKPLLLTVLLFLSGPVMAEQFEQALSHVASGEYSKAAAAFHALAEEGDLAAAHNLAVLFSLGQGVPRSFPDAGFWAWRALLDGLDQTAPLAGQVLSELSDPERVKISDRLEQHFSPQAETGAARAMLALAVIQIVLRPEPDYLAAYAWQSIAAALDHHSAAQAREMTRNMMPAGLRSGASEFALAAFRDWCALQGETAPVSCAVVMASH